MQTQQNTTVSNTMHVPMSDAEKQALLDAALPKLEKAVKADKKKRNVKIPADMAGSPSLSSKGKAPMSMLGYGKSLGEDYINALGSAAMTWQQGVVYLLKSCSDIQRNDAMDGAMKVAKSCKDQIASDSLKKRISEARRVFKAAQGKGTAKIVKVFEKPGTWHQKVTSLPKASNAGRPKSTPVTPTATVQEAMASVENAGKLETLPGMDGHTKVGTVKLGDVFGMIERLSIPDCLKVLDLCAGKIMACKEPNYSAVGKEVVSLRERQEEAIRKAA